MNTLLKRLSEVADNLGNTAVRLFNEGSNIRLTGVGKGKDLDDVATMRNLSEATFEELTLGAFQALVTARTVVKGKVYNITDNGINEAFGGHKLQIIGKEASEFNEYVIEGLLYNTNNNDYWNTTLNVSTGIYLSFHNPKYNIKCNTAAMFEQLQQSSLGSAALNGRILDCNFNNYTGTITLDTTNTTLKNCDFSNSSANFTTTNLNTAATFSGRILHAFTIPDQISYPCEFANTIVINGDGTNNLTVTIILSATSLDCTDFTSCGILDIRTGSESSLFTLSGLIVDREYLIISNSTNALVINSNNNIIFDYSNGSVSEITWGGTNSRRNELYIKYTGTDVLVLGKSSYYL